MAHMFVGLVLCALGVWGVVAWWDVFGMVMRGVIPFAALIVGLAALMSGVRGDGRAAKNSQRSKSPPTVPV